MNRIAIVLNAHGELDHISSDNPADVFVIAHLPADHPDRIVKLTPSEQIMASLKIGRHHVNGDIGPTTAHPTTYTPPPKRRHLQLVE